MSDSTSIDVPYRTKRRRVKALVNLHLRNAFEVFPESIDTESNDTGSGYYLNEAVSPVREIGTEAGYYLNEAVSPVSEIGTEEVSDILTGSVDLLLTSGDDTEFDVESFWKIYDADRFTFFDDVQYDSSDSDGESENECVVSAADKMLIVKTKLKQWSTDFNISGAAVSCMLKILHDDAGLELPRDARTLLGTPKSTDVTISAGGSYSYISVVSSICYRLDRQTSSCCRLKSCELTLDVNIDGLPLFRSSNCQLWPILVMVKEFVHTDPFVVGLFCGSSKPSSLDEYLKDFICEIKTLTQTGLEHNGVRYSIKLGAFICDAPARAYIKCIKGHSGYFACERCTQEGVHVNGRMTFPEQNASARTDEQFRNMVAEDHHTGLSPLTQLDVGMVTQFPLDYMHLVCLGVVRRMILLWLKGPLKCRLSSQSVDSCSVDLVLLRNCLPKEFCRKPRSLKEFLMWKATEFRQFLIYTGPVVLRSTLNSTMYNNFMLLSVSMTALLSPSLCQHYCDYAEKLLAIFVDNFATIYGKTFIGYNMHNLIHLPQDVRKFGSLGNVSAFPFENFLGKLKKKVRKPQNPIAQIMHRYHEMSIVVSPNSCHCNSGRPDLRKEHTQGPLPARLSVSCTQYRHYYRDNVVISSCVGDNCFEILGNVALIRNILLHANGEINVVFVAFNTKEDYFTYPLDSSDLGIYQVSNLSAKLDIASVGVVGKKYVLLPYRQMHLAFPLLHLNDQ